MPPSFRFALVTLLVASALECRAQGAGSLSDLFHDDALISRVFQEKDRGQFVNASNRYLEIIARAGEDFPPGEKAILDRHIAQLQPVLDADFQDLRNSTSSMSEGERLVLWWRRQDPLPATVWNERIIEHLERVAIATARYRDDTTPAGWDDRGEIYIRLGAPTSIDRIGERVARSGGLKATTLPSNEYWSYDFARPPARYLFVSERGRFRHATPIKLLPLEYQHMRASIVGIQEQRGLLIGLIHDLSRVDPSFTASYFDISEPLNNSQQSTSGVGIASLMRAGQSLFSVAMGGEVWSRLLSIERVHRSESRMRDRSVPAVRSTIIDPSDTLVYDARVVRFLGEGGVTCAVPYWRIPPRKLAPSARRQFELARLGNPSPRRFRLGVAYVLQDAAFDTQRISRQLHDVEMQDSSSHIFTSFICTEQALFHVAMQIDQYAMADTGTDTDPRVAFVRTGTYRADSLYALDKSPEKLEMSDLVPLQPSPFDDARVTRTDDRFTLRPYFFDRLYPDTSIALYFEVYHLAYADDDLTHFTVEYEITHDERSQGIAGLLGRREQRITSASTSYTRESRTAREYIVLDLSSAPSGEVSVRIRVTDEVTGQITERVLGIEKRR